MTCECMGMMTIDDIYDITMTGVGQALPDDGIKQALMTLDKKVHF